MSATQRQARCIAHLESGIERMIALQMLSYPDGWTETEKREAAQLHLFGTVDETITIKKMVAA